MIQEIKTRELLTYRLENQNKKQEFDINMLFTVSKVPRLCEAFHKARERRY